jgi:uncharacterized protein YfcZ (UPF0381/DUF406 family)
VEVAKPVDIPQCSHFVNANRWDDKEDGTIMVQKNTCSNRAFVREASRANIKRRFYQDWEFEPVGGEADVNVYHIISRRHQGRCNEKNLLAVANNGCNRATLRLDESDDGSGKHQWIIEEDETRGGFTIKNVKRDNDDCAHRYMWVAAKRSLGQAAMTDKVDDARSLWRFEESETCNVEHIDEELEEQNELEDDLEELEEGADEENDVNWWRRPRWNNWNFSRNWNAPRW